MISQTPAGEESRNFHTERNLRPLGCLHQLHIIHHSLLFSGGSPTPRRRSSDWVMGLKRLINQRNHDVACASYRFPSLCKTGRSNNTLMTVRQQFADVRFKGRTTLNECTCFRDSTDGTLCNNVVRGIWSNI